MFRSLQTSRRAMVVGIGALGVAAIMPRIGQAALKPVAGMAPEPWFAETTFDLRNDLKRADDAGKMLALLWEQHGCEYCREMHAVALKQPNLIALGEKRFHVIQMDLWGKREFINFDGETVSETKLARNAAVRGTPTTQFFDGAGKQVFRMPGYAAPEIFFLVYEYVAEAGYQTASLEKWAERKYRQ